MEKVKKVAFATLDIGTSQIKLGVYCPQLSKEIILIDNVSNECIYGTAGEVRTEYGPIREKSFQLLKALGSFVNSNCMTTLYLGICGHVSSLIEWNKKKGCAPHEPFPIWLDTTSYPSLDEYNAVMGNGRSKEIIGTFLPTGTNWLFTKLLERRKSGFDENSIFLQVSDAIYYELTGSYVTHFSSQISMVNLTKRTYAVELLDHLQLDKSHLPSIQYDPAVVCESQRKLFGFPQQTYIFPGMADLYTSLHGLRLEDREGFMLANTSEQAGAFYINPPKALDNFLNISFDPGFINYGSTNTGGNVLSWFVTNIISKNMSSPVLDDFTSQAASIEPQNTPIILPYLQGERAPLWNSKLTASILELQSSHTDAHLFRAILESISFARKQCFDEIGIDGLRLIKIAGGSSKNSLWNKIRASVLNKRLAVADEKELAMAGFINYMIDSIKSEVAKPAINFSITDPEPTWIDTYQQKYERFITYQKILSSP